MPEDRNRWFDDTESDAEGELDEGSRERLSEFLTRALRGSESSPDTVELFFSLFRESPSASSERAKDRARHVLGRMGALPKESAAELLRVRREAEGLTLRQASQHLGTAVPALQRLEDGASGLLFSLDPRKLAHYLHLLGLEVDQLLERMFPLPSSGPAFAYSPRTSTEEREALHANTGSSDDTRIYAWVRTLIVADHERSS